MKNDGFLTFLGHHTVEVQKGLSLGVVLFIISEIFAFLSVFWAFFHSSLSPAVEIGGSWPPLGITALDPFAIPLLNTVWSAINTNNEAVWVGVPLYILTLSNKLVFFFTLQKTGGRVINFISKLKLTKFYTTITSNIENENNFYQWLSGFTDGEGNFIIITLPKGFSFRFSIGLHIDDLPVLNYIQNKLGFGIVYSYKTKCYYNVTRKEDIIKLISIFDDHTLNSSKRLDYLDFKKAFVLYNDRTNLSKIIIDQVIELKNSMNTQRTKLDWSKININISKSWLLGLIEADSSFSLNRKIMEPVFLIQLTESQLPLLIEIKQYLENNLGFDQYSIQKLNSSSIISIKTNKAVNNSKPMATLKIANILVLNNYLIPFLKECIFISKKGLDFKDFKIICKAIYIGAHRVTDIKDLILKLSYTMNNYRLSTYLGKDKQISLFETDKIINAKATIEYLNDGLKLDVETKKIINNRSGSSIYEIITSSDKILLLPNLAKSAKELEIGFNNLKKKFVNQVHSIEINNKKITRIGVFLNKLDKKE